MALIARIHAAGQPTPRIVRLRKGRNRLELQPGERVEIVDEKTGQAPADAHAVRAGDDLVVTADATTVHVGGFYGASAGDVAISLPGTGYVDVSPVTSLAACAAAGAEGAAGGGMSPWAIAAIGAVAVGAGVAVATGGGKSKDGGQSGNAVPPATPTNLDLAAADDSGASNSDNLTNQASGLTITGKADPGSTVQILAGGTVLASGAANASGDFSIDVTLPAGATTITARATGPGGNSGVSTALVVTVDATAPAAPAALDLAAADDSGASNSDNITGQTSALTVTGTAEAGARVELFAGATSLGTVTAGANGAFGFEATLPAGAAALTARATDLAGNVSNVSATLSVTVDTAAPSAISIGDVSGGRIGTAEQAATVSVALAGFEAGATRTVTLSGTDATSGQPLSIAASVDAAGNLALTPAVLSRFADGNFTIAAQQTDTAGNAGATASTTAVLDRSAPTLSINSASALLEGAQTTTLTFTFSEAPTGFDAGDVSVAGGAISNFAATADPRVFTATLTPTLGAAGAVVVTVATGAYGDAAGNAGAASNAGAIAFDPGASGSGIDGYIAFALVFRDSNNDGAWNREAFTDANNNGVRDGGEAFVDADNDGVWDAERFTTTDANGDFANLFGTGRIVLAPLVAGVGTGAETILTRDISTGAVFTKQFSAPEGSTVVTPLTTLVEAVAGAGASAAAIAQAESTVKAALGIPADVDLKTFDPIAAATAPGATAAEQEAAIGVQKVAVQVANILNVVSTAASAADAYGSAAEAATVAAGSLAAQITQLAAGDTLNLANSAVVAAVISDVAAQGDAAGRAALAQQAASVSTALATVNEAVGQVDAGASPAAALAQVVATQIVAQVELAAAASNAVETNATLDATAFSGAALGEKVDAAAAQVQVIVPVVQTPQALGAPGRPSVDDGTRVTSAEAANGIQVSVSYTDAAGVQAGDKLRVIYDGTDFELTLGANDVPGAGETKTLTVAVPALGADGAKTVVAAFVAADGTVGPASLPLLVTIDTGVVDPTVRVVSDGAVNADEAAAGVRLAIDGIELGSTVALTLSGVSKIDGTPLDDVVVPRVDNELRLTSTLLDQFADGSLTLTVRQTDLAGNVSAPTTRTFTLDRTAPATVAIGDVSGGFVNASESLTDVALSLTGVENGATQLVRVSGTAVGGGALALTVANNVLTPAQLAQFADGQLTVTAVQTDAAGNASAPATRTFALDTVANAPTGLTLLAADDTGASSNDRLTSRASVTISGSGAEAGATVTLSTGATATADNAGRFSFANVSLANGMNSFTATQTDVAGNVSAVSAALTVTRDSAAPTAPTNLALLAADDTGASNGDGLTNRVSVTITGSAEANSTVQILSGATIVATGTADGAGQFSIAGVALADGANALTARATDAAGNTGPASGTLNITRDSTAPANAAIGGGALADGVVDASERFARFDVTGTEANAAVAVTASGARNGAPVTLGVAPDIVSRNWGTDGLVSVDFGGGEFSRALTVLADGRVLVAGSFASATAPASDPQSMLAMLNPDGTLDTSFGTGGKATGDFVVGQPVTEDIRKVIALADGGFLVVGQTFSGANSGFVGKFTASGAVDASFGTNGAIRFGTSTSGVDGALNASQQADGKILIAARLSSPAGTNNEIATIRLNTDGSLDSTFGTDGIARSGFGGGSRSVFAVEQADGKILNIGFGGGQAIVSKLNADGTPDTSFGANGRLNVASPTGVSFMGQPTIDAGGRIVFAGYGLDANGAGTSFVGRLNADGTLDTGFGANGIRVLPAPAPGHDTTLFQVAVDGLGNVVVGGSSFEPLFGTHAVLMRLTSNGALDTSFDGNGILMTKQLVQVLGLTVTDTGAILAAAGAAGAGADPSDVGVLRIEPGQTGGFRLSVDDQLLGFDPGQLTITVTQTDAAGNVGTTTFDATYNPLQGSANADVVRGTAAADAITGGAGGDRLLGAGGDDAIDGGADRDTALYQLPAGLVGVLEFVDGGSAGVFLVRLAGAAPQNLYRLTANGDGSVTVTGLGAAVGDGTDTLTNVENVSFSGPGIGSVTTSFDFDPAQIPAGATAGNFTVTGSVLADTIDVAALAPTLTAAATVTVTGGLGDDVITGHAGLNTLDGEGGDDSLSGLGGNDTLTGGAGDDTLLGGDGNDSMTGGDGADVIDGGAAADTDIARFGAPAGLTGTIRFVAGTGADADKAFVERVDGATVERLFEVTPTGVGSATVKGLNSAAGLGTDTVTNVDQLQFGLGATSLTAFLTVGQTAFTGTPPTASLFGSLNADTLDVAAAFPGVQANQNVNVIGALGADTLVGHAGNNYLEGGAGDDSLTGGLGFDTAGFVLPVLTAGALRAVDGTGADAAAKFVERVDGSGIVIEQVARVQANANGTVTVTGLGTAAFLGTDTLAGMENVFFSIAGATVGNVGFGIFINANPLNNNNAFVGGSGLGDAIDVAALYPTATAADTINVNGNQGNDTILGHAGNNFLDGGQGNDAIDGGAGRDTANFFNNTPNTGAFTYAVVDGAGADAGKLFVTRTNGTTTETFYRVTPTGVGAATVESLGSSAHLGTDTVTNVEDLNFNGPSGGTVINLAVSVNAINNNFGQVNGSVLDDSIDLVQVYNNPATSLNLNVNAGRGDDGLFGHDGGNYLEGGQGNDFIDGRGGYDTAGYALAAGTTGTLRQVAGAGAEAGFIFVERVDGATVERVLRIEKSGANVIVTGLGSGASFGADTLINVEQVAIGIINPGQPLLNEIYIQVAPNANPINNGQAGINGSAFGDTINVADFYPGLTAATQVGVNGGGGGDILVGHAGNNFLEGGAGDDQIDGGPGGSDVANYFITTPGGNLIQVAGTHPGQTIIRRVDGATAEDVFRVTNTGSGTATVEGLNSAAGFGTDTLVRIGGISFGIQGGNGTFFNSGVTSGVDGQGFTFVNGSNLGDTIDLAAALVTAPVGPSGVRVSAFAGNDTILGHAGDSRLVGDDGDDTITGGGGNDEIFGGNGADVAVFSGNRADYTVSRNPQTGNIIVVDNRGGSPDGTDTLNGFDVETLRFANQDVAAAGVGAIIDGDGGNNQLNGTPGGDTMTGQGGDDSLYGDGGDDTLTGGAGNDYINGAGGFDTAVFGGSRADYTITNLIGGGVQVSGPDGIDYVGNTTERLQFSDQTITLAGAAGGQFNPGDVNASYNATGGAGDDYMNGSNVNDLLDGGDGDDTVFAGDGNDIVRGHTGDDDLTGWNGNDELVGSVGSDRLNGNDGDDLLIGGFNAFGGPQAGDLADELRGGNGNDVLRGGDGGDLLFGDAGDDNLRGDAGDDVINGGDGRDFAAYRFDHLGGGQTINFEQFGATNSFAWADGLGGTDQVSNMEQLGITGTQGNDTIRGSLFLASTTAPDGGLLAANQLSGAGGDDAIHGGTASDLIFGDNVNDPAFDGNDTVFAGDGGDVVYGNGGNDVLNGEGGDDDLQGDRGDDAIDGGAGIDTAYYSGLATDYRIDRLQNGSVQVVDLRGGSPDGADTLTNVEKVAFTNPDGTNAVYTLGFVGDDANNGVGGGNDDNLLIGNGGDDYLSGNGGDDLSLGGSGFDIAGFALPVGTTGTLSIVEGAGGDAGKLLVLRTDNNVVETVFRVTPGAPGTGTATVEGVGFAAGLGTDRVVAVEDLHFFIERPNNTDPFPLGNFVAIKLAVNAGQLMFNAGIGSNFAFVDGSEFADALDARTLYAGVLATDRVDIQGNRGDDSITGHDGLNFLNGGAGADTISGLGGNDGIDGGAGDDTLHGGTGDDFLQGAAGDDSLDGGTGNDTAGYRLVPGVNSTLRVIDDPANPGKLIVERVNGSESLVEQVVRVTVTGPGAATVEGLGAYAIEFGTDTIVNADNISIFIQNGPSANINLTPNVFTNDSAQFFVNGTPGADTLSVTALIPDVANTARVNVEGDRGNDAITGHDGANYANGGAGDDTIALGGGDDSARGSEGDDSIDGGAGRDVAQYALPAGTAGSLRYVADPANAGQFLVQRVEGATIEDLFRVNPTGPGAATVTGLGARAAFGADTVTNVEELHFFVDFGINQFVNINLTPVAFPANQNPAFINGSVLGDTLDVATFFPGATATTPVNANGNEGDDTITGHDGANNIQGAAGDDTLAGAGGNDVLVGGDGDDTVVGGTGLDFAQFILPAGSLTGTLSVRDGATAGTFVVQRAPTGQASPVDDLFLITVTGPNAATVQGLGVAAFLGTDTVTDIERLEFFVSSGPFTSLNFAPTSFPAGANPAFIQGSIGGDTLDVATFFPAANAMTVVNVNADRGDDMITGHVGNNNLTGGAGADTIIGGDGNDTLIGGFNTGFGAQPGDLADVLIGGNGNDVLRGGDGDDNLRGDFGSDLMDGGAGNDFVSYFFAAAAQGVTFDLSGFTPGSPTDFTIADPLGGTDTLRNIETAGVGGSNFDDVITGSLAAVAIGTGVSGIDRGYANQLGGNAGDDQIAGGDDDDRLEGGTGDDVLAGGAGNDLAAYNFGGANEITNAPLVTAGVAFSAAALTDPAQPTQLDAGVLGTDTLTGIERVGVTGSQFADTLTGSAGGDLLSGGSGADTIDGGVGGDFLFGDAGDDVLAGGIGADRLTGGAGADEFVLEGSAGTTLSLADVITDFEVGTDKMVIEGGLTFDDLTIDDDGAGGSIVMKDDGTILAVVQNVAPLELTSASFMMSVGG